MEVENQEGQGPLWAVVTLMMMVYIVAGHSYQMCKVFIVSELNAHFNRVALLKS
jgi:hypothetical protein